MFEITDIRLGLCEPGIELQLMFFYKGIKISRMVASCGCSVPTDSIARSLVKVSYTPPKDFPPHIKERSNLPFNKTITVEYTIPSDPNPDLVHTVELKFGGFIKYT